MLFRYDKFLKYVVLKLWRTILPSGCISTRKKNNKVKKNIYYCHLLEAVNQYKNCKNSNIKIMLCYEDQDDYVLCTLILVP